MSRLVGSFSARARAGACLLGLGLAIGCVEQAEEKPSAEDQEFVKKNLLSSAPTPQFAVNADLDGKVVYLGADVSPNPAEAGKDVKVTHYWKVNGAPGEGWRTFTHVQGPNRAGYMNVDHGPVRGNFFASSGNALSSTYGSAMPTPTAVNSENPTTPGCAAPTRRPTPAGGAAPSRTTPARPARAGAGSTPRRSPRAPARSSRPARWGPP